MTITQWLESAVETITRLAELKESDAYKELITGGMSPHDAIKEVFLRDAENRLKEIETDEPGQLPADQVIQNYNRAVRESFRRRD